MLSLSLSLSLILILAILINRRYVIRIQYTYCFVIRYCLCLTMMRLVALGRGTNFHERKTSHRTMVKLRFNSNSIDDRMYTNYRRSRCCCEHWTGMHLRKLASFIDQRSFSVGFTFALLSFFFFFFFFLKKRWKS